MCAINKLILIVVLYCSIHAITAHKYKSGECPTVEPISGFEMKKFLGLWYAIQKIDTASECIIYNITQDEPGHYKIQQISQNFLLGSLKHKYSYTGELEVKDSAIPAKMKVDFPLNPGSADFTVFMTDYVQFAGIFTCQKLPVGHRHSATILSRTRDLENIYVEKVRNRLASSQVDPFDLSIISQKKCPILNEDGGVNIDIDPDTFSSKNIGGWFKKAGDKIGDGVEWSINQGKKVYKHVRGNSDENSNEARSSRLVAPQINEENSMWFP